MGSANVTVAVNVGANVTANTSALKVGNSTVNSIITSTTASVGSNVVANTSALLIGNSSVNTVITANSASLGNTTITGFANVSSTFAAGNTTITGFANISSTLAAGNTTITGFANVSSTLAAGNTTVTGFANVSSTLAAGNTTITGFANISSTANVGGATNLRSTLDVVGATTISNTLSSGNTSTANLSVTGFANVSGTANVGGATNLRSTLTVNGAVVIANTLSSGNTSTANLDVTGFANVSGSANVGGATNLRSTLTVNGAVTIANTVSSGNTTITGFANVTSTLAAGDTTITGFANVSGTANVGGATNLRSTLTVNGAVTIANTVSSGNTSTANLSVTGFANVSGTANVGGAVNLRDALTVNGAVTIANSVASGNNDLTGYINVSTTANVGGATNLRSTLTVNGAVVIANTLSSGNTTVANLTVSGVINRNPTITLGGDLTGSVTLTDLQNGTLTATIATDSIALGTDTTGDYVANIAVANGISGAVSGEGSTPTLRVVPNNGIVANSTGVFAKAANGISVDASGINVTAGQGIVANSSGVFAKAANGISVDASGINVSAGVGLFANASGVHVNTATIATVGSPTFTGDAGFANITITGIINANGSVGSADQVLRTDGSGKVYWANPLLAGDTGFIEDVSNGVGLSKGGTSKIPSLAVIANNGIVANSTGTFVNANNGIVANSTGTFVRANTGLVANSTGLFVNASYIATISANNASYLGGELPAYYTNATNISTGTLAVAQGGTGVTTANGTGSVIRQSDAVFLANTTIARMVANGALGTAGQHLAANSTGGLYWETPQVGDITAVTAGNGITGGGSSGDVTVTVNAQTGLLANSSGLYVNASSVAVGVLPVGVGGTGATTFTSGGLLRGNGTSAVSVASAADIVAAIGTTRVANATYADDSGLATNATRATASNNSLVADDTTSAGTYYPVWVDATSGDKPIKLSSTKLTFNPSTGVLSATSFSGSGASLTGLDAGNIGAGTLPVARGGTGVTSSTGTTSVVLSASPTLTGTPAAPTAAVDTNTTQIATTAYVIGQGYLKSGTAASTYLPLAGGTVTGNLTVSGNLTINGTTTNINATNLVVEDKNIILGDVTTPSNTTADGGGITLNGATNKTLNWVNATGAWTSSEDFNLLTGKAYYINGSLVLSNNQLGAGVITSALTSVGTIGVGVWQGTAVGVAYGGTGATDAGTARTNLGLGNVTNESKATMFSSPTFTGTPLATTAAADTNTTQIATTAYVIGQGYLKSATASSTYSPIAGSTSITTLGTITAGTWNGSTIAVARGGTGATTESGARTALGATTLGGNIFTITNPSAVTFPRFNADNTISSLSATDFRTAIGAGTSSTTGTVTSVANGSGLSGGTITSTGTLSVDSTVIRTTGAQTRSGNTILSGVTNASTGTLIFKDHMTVALSDEDTAITTGTAKITFRAPYAMELYQIPRASLSTVSSSGTPTVDINVDGTSILSTKLTIDANEKTSTTAATAAVMTSNPLAIADDAEITMDIDTAGTGAKGLKVTLYFRRQDPGA